MVETFTNWTWKSASEDQKLQEKPHPEDLNDFTPAARSCGAASLLPLLVLASRRGGEGGEAAGLPRRGGEGGEAAGLPPLQPVLEAPHWRLLGLAGGRN